MRRTWVSLLLTLAAATAAAILSPYRAITPGTLSAGHLGQRDDCLSCHSLLRGAPAEKCAGCHRPGDVGVRTTRGEPLARPKERARRIHEALRTGCDRCHSEHGGRAGARRFAHDLLPAGVAEGCAACHAADRPKDALHETAAGECGACHRVSGWKPASFDHERSFRFDRHHPARCTDCHPPGRSLKEYSCTGCHEHSPARLQAKHREEGITDLGRCRRCHPSGDEDDTIRGEGRDAGRGGKSRDGDDD